VNFTVSAHTLTSKQPALLLPLSSILNLTTVILSIIIFQTVNWLQHIQNSLARAVVKASKSTHSTPILKSLLRLKVNKCIEHKLLSLTYKVLKLNLAIFTTLSLFNLLAVPTSHLLSLFLACQPSPPWKSQIAHLGVHHLIFGTSRFISSASPFLSRFTSSSTCQPISHHPCSHHPSLFRSRLKTYLFNKSFPR